MLRVRAADPSLRAHARRPRSASARLVAGVMIPLLGAACGGADSRADGSGVGGAESPADGRPAVTVREPGYTIGDAAARVTVIEFSDFGCGYCRQFALTTYPELHRRYIETGLVRWRYVPFVSGGFPNADGATVAAECAAEQGGESFWAMKEALYETQREWRVAGAGAAPFLALADRLGLDEAAFELCLASDRPRHRVEASNRMASMGSVTGTPTFYVEGRRALGALTAEQFGGLLEIALAERSVRVP